MRSLMKLKLQPSQTTLSYRVVPIEGEVGGGLLSLLSLARSAWRAAWRKTAMNVLYDILWRVARGLGLALLSLALMG